MERHRRRAAYALFGVVGWFVVSWSVAIVVDWQRIARSDVEPAYLIGDWGLVVPLCIATSLGLLKRASWAPLLFLVTMGAIAFEALHFGIHLILARFLSIPTPVYVAGILLVLGFVGWFTRHEIRFLSERIGPRHM